MNKKNLTILLLIAISMVVAMISIDSKDQKIEEYEKDFQFMEQQFKDCAMRDGISVLTGVSKNDEDKYVIEGGCMRISSDSQSK